MRDSKIPTFAGNRSEPEHARLIGWRGNLPEEGVFAVVHSTQIMHLNT